MKRNFRKMFLVAIMAVWMLFLLAGCWGSKETPIIEMPKNPGADVFNKTIHDFGGLRVDNLDEQEDTNFIVYAEGVQEITMTADRNVLVETDFENLSYSFTNADDILKSMEKGDVFFASASDLAPEGVTAKVKKIKVSGDHVTVYSEQVGLADFFEYVDISMDVPLTLEGESPAVAAAFGRRQSVSASNPIHLPLRYPYELSVGATMVNGSLGADLLVHVDWRFDAKTMQFYCDMYSDTTFDHTFNLSYGGQLLEKEFKGKTPPARIGGFCTLALESTLTVSVSGEVKGNLHYTAADRYGFTAYASSRGAAFQSYQQNLHPGVGEGSLGNMEADVNVDLELKPVLGFGFIGNVFATVGGGVNIHGETEPIVETPSPEEVSIHACEFCIDGDVNTSASISCGMELTLVSTVMDLFVDEEIKSDLEDLGNGVFCPEKEFYSNDWKVSDFYISKRGEEQDYGWTECPHYLYRTTVTVTNEDGSPADGAFISVEMSNDTLDYVNADASGQAIIYLPTGENTLEASAGEETGTATIVVEKEPSEWNIGMVSTADDWILGVYFEYEVNTVVKEEKVNEMFDVDTHWTELDQNMQGWWDGNYVEGWLEEYSSEKDGCYHQLIRQTYPDVRRAFGNLYSSLKEHYAPDYPLDTWFGERVECLNSNFTDPNMGSRKSQWVGPGDYLLEITARDRFEIDGSKSSPPSSQSPRAVLYLVEDDLSWTQIWSCDLSSGTGELFAYIDQLLASASD